MAMAPKSKSNENGGGKAPAPSRSKKNEDVGTDEYLKRRERNNLAVKKSRDKSRLKAKETINRVAELRQENTLLEQKVSLLSKELSLLKDLFLAHAGSTADGSCQPATSEVEGSPQVNAEAVRSDHEYAISSNDEDSNSK